MIAPLLPSSKELAPSRPGFWLLGQSDSVGFFYLEIAKIVLVIDTQAGLVRHDTGQFVDEVSGWIRPMDQDADAELLASLGVLVPKNGAQCCSIKIDKND